MRLFKISFQAVFLLVISAGLLTGGCVNKSIFSKSPEKNLSLDNKGIQMEITRLEEITKNAPQSPVDSRLFLSLCLLYSNPNNKQPDYRRAQKMLEAYLTLHPGTTMTNDVLYLSSLLMQINHVKDKQNTLTAQYDKLKKDAELLQADSADIKEEKNQLISENKSLKDIIEQLKQLDIRLEEKRNAF